MLGLIPLSGRPKGISVMMRVKNEERWIETSIKSIVNIADEIIIADNGSTDSTLEVVNRLVVQYSPKIVLYNLPGYDICDLSNALLDKTHYYWVLRWDADFVARTSGEINIYDFRKRILSLSRQKYYVIYLNRINLYVDLLHQWSDHPTYFENYMHVFTEESCYKRFGMYEVLVTPDYFKRLVWEEPYFFHVDVKSDERMFLRWFWTDWLEAISRGEKYGLNEYICFRIKKDWGLNKWEDGVAFVKKELQKKIVKYDENKYGPYPDLLRPYLETLD